MKRTFILFDFDGVIADSYAVAFYTARRICAHVSEDEYRSMFEGNVYEAADMLTRGAHGPECHHDLDWFDIFTPAFEERARPFPGIAEVIEAFSHDYVLAIISSTVTSPIQGFLERFGLGRYFSEVMGADVHTSKVEKLHMLFEKYGTDASQCVFVTDTLGDMREAKVHGVGTIGCAWGFHSRETLQKGIPFCILAHPRELPDAIAGYFGRA